MPRHPIPRSIFLLNSFLLALTIALAPLAARAAVPLSEVQRAGAAAFSPTVRLIDEAAVRGELTYSEAAVQKLFYLFDRESMDARFEPEGSRPSRCGTLILDELRQNRDRLDEEARALYDRFIGSAESFPTQAMGVYETTNFYIQWSDNGPNGVPSDDVDPANGIPDFVEKVGLACEFSWARSVTDLGYNPPPASSATQYNGKFLIQFQDQSSYGYTTVLSGQRTKIVLHPNYVGFPPNDDPDGNELGAMRVTVAHEFKHAIQRTYTNWTEGGWVELDATWMEDIVYDGINDYYNYIFGGGSPFTSPDLPLDNDGTATTGSYEDCNWQHYQSELFGNTHMLNFWLRRQSHPAEAVLFTYEQNLIASGSSLTEAWGQYVAWNIASGDRSSVGFGYGEAPSYPTTPVTTSYEALPVPTSGGSVQRLAANTHLVTNLDGALGGTPEFVFDGDPATDWSVGVLVKDLGANLSLVRMTLASGSGSLTLSGYDWIDLEFAALVIGNANTAGTPSNYTFSIQAIEPVHIVHQKLWNTTETTLPYSVTAEVTSGTDPLDATSVVLLYSVNAGAQQSMAMNATGNPDEYGAEIPSQPIGSSIDYRIVAQSSLGDSVSSPAREGWTYPFDVVTVFEPFESPGAWTVGYPGDAASTGVWELAIPVGSAAAPAADFTSPPGDSCYLTENAGPGEPIGTADVDGGKTTLVSPVFDLGSGGPYESVVVRYRRWYSNEQGAAVDDTWRVYASNDSGQTWSVFESETSGSPSWQLVSQDLLGFFAESPDQVQFRFVADDSGSGSVVEAAVDDFEIIAIPQATVDVVVGGNLATLRMSPVVPNPLTASGAFFTLDLPSVGPVQVLVIDARGRVVRTLVPAGSVLPAGRHRLDWDGRADSGSRLSSGVYFLRAVTGQGSVERKVTLLR